jgi:hypothetical protein
VLAATTFCDPCADVRTPARRSEIHHDRVRTQALRHILPIR